ncbi:hypothetical protein [Hymenobacter jejuensis]|uniref:Uncharacterized protein n=1 Tax=Hymenobacter jejuensis TaxID=2502781 RepID=A0A5B8A2R7_9BACT|nr:hypothetical protein [Hymenobacter jejuensis]QDA61608.1 hypothetical protein FHG12_16555 [Hymenobacter jejuensis]
MWKATLHLAALLATVVGFGQVANAQQTCKCTGNQVCQCVAPGGGLTWSPPKGKAGGTHMPVPVETLIAGMTYVLKPESEKQAYLTTLSGPDQQFIVENAATLRESVQNLQNDHNLYKQEMGANPAAPTKVERPISPQIKVQDRVINRRVPDK